MAGLDHENVLSRQLASRGGRVAMVEDAIYKISGVAIGAYSEAMIALYGCGADDRACMRSAVFGRVSSDVFGRDINGVLLSTECSGVYNLSDDDLRSRIGIVGGGTSIKATLRAAEISNTNRRVIITEAEFLGLVKLDNGSVHTAELLVVQASGQFIELDV